MPVQNVCVLTTKYLAVSDGRGVVFNDDFAAIVQVAFVDVGTVKLVYFTGGKVSTQRFGGQEIVGTTHIAAAFGMSAFRMSHGFVNVGITN